MTDLKQATRKALVWSAVDRVGQQMLNMVVAIVTARILAPEIFGLTASLAIFTAVGTVLLDGGVSLALIRQTASDERDHNTVFWFNVTVSLTLYLILFFCAPLIARFYNEPSLVPIARILFLVIPFNGAAIIHSTLLIKRMRFSRLATANLTAVIASGGLAVAMALSGAGVWTLVAQQVAGAALKTGMLTVLCRWRPRAVFCTKSFRSIFSFSYKLLFGSLVTAISGNFYTFILKRYFAFDQVGFYGNAAKMKEGASSVIWNAFGSSTYAALSNLQDDPARLCHAMRKIVRTLAFVAFPVMLGLAVIARPVVEILITGVWLPALPYVRLLSVGAIFYILNFINANFVKIRGRSDLTLRMDALGAAMLIGFLFLTIRFGLQVAIVSDIVSKMIVYAIYMRINARLSGYRVGRQLRDIAPYAVLGVVMAAAIWPLGWLISNNLLLLGVQLVLGGVIYLGAAWLLGSVVLGEVLESVRKTVKRFSHAGRG
jgi:O-antigen/teichoic acid export membrane protein